jgi:hypothetical protein
LGNQKEKEKKKWRKKEQRIVKSINTKRRKFKAKTQRNKKEIIPTYLKNYLKFYRKLKQERDK